MRTLNFWKTLFCAALLTTAFTACSDSDDENGYLGNPEISVNGSDKAVVAAGLEGGPTEAVEVVAKGNWTLVFKNAADEAWCTPSVLSGETGTVSLTFKLAAATAARETFIELLVKGEVAGYPIIKKADITVKQNASGAFKVILNETFGTAEINKTPIADYKEWGTTGSGSADVKFVGTEKTDLRRPAKSSEGAYEGASGSNALFFGTAPTSFTVENITLTSEETNLQLTFGGNSFVYDTKDNTFNISNFKISLSDDGVSFVPLTYTINDGDTKAPYWVLATANFTLTKAVSKLYVKFEALTSSIYRLDDITLQTGEGGQSIDLDATTPEPEPETVTISQITAAGAYEVKGATVVAASTTAYMIADATGAMLVYGNEGNHQVGEKIDISGDVTVYQAPNNTPQFNKEAVVTVVSSGNSWTYNYAKYTATEIQAYLNDVKCVAVEIAGTIVKDGNFYNLILSPEAADLQGSIQNYTPTADQLDKPVVVKGYAIGKSISGAMNRIKIFPKEIVVDATTPIVTITAPAQFTAAGNSQDISFSTANIPSGSSVFAKVEGADAAQFTVGTIANGKVPVTAQANTAASAKTTTLTVYIATAEGAAAVASDNVTLTQAGVSSGDDTQGTYTWMDGLLPTSDNSTTDYYYGSSTVAANGAAAASFLRLGKSKFAGVYTTPALGITGNKKLSFYAVGWKGADTKVYVRVNDGGSISGSPVEVSNNEGYSGSGSIFTMTLDASNYFTFELTGLTASSTITISTSSSFAGGADSANKSRAGIIGLQVY